MKILKNIAWALALMSFVGVVQWDPTSDYDFDNQIVIVLGFLALAVSLEVAYTNQKTKNQ